MKLPITGLKHYDFRDHLEDLFLRAVGRRVTLCIEPDNPKEHDAVLALLAGKQLGHVRTQYRAQAVAVIRQGGSDMLLGQVVQVEPEGRILWVEVDADTPTPAQVEACRHPATPLSRWEYQGPLLPEDSRAVQLRAVSDTLRSLVSTLTPWDDDMDACIDIIHQYGWMDISTEIKDSWLQTIALMEVPEAPPQYHDKAAVMRLQMDRIGSQQARQQMAASWAAAAQCPETAGLAFNVQVVAAASEPCVKERIDALAVDGEQMLMQLWYNESLSRHQLRALYTVTAATYYRRSQSSGTPLTSLPLEWVLRWISREKDYNSAKAVVHMVMMFCLDNLEPQLSHTLESLLSQSHTTSQLSQGINSIVQSLSERPPLTVESLNNYATINNIHSNGTVALPPSQGPDTTEPQSPEPKP